jgi:hypothetical protein
VAAGAAGAGVVAGGVVAAGAVGAGVVAGGVVAAGVVAPGAVALSLPAAASVEGVFAPEAWLFPVAFVVGVGDPFGVCASEVGSWVAPSVAAAPSPPPQPT